MPIRPRGLWESQTPRTTDPFPTFRFVKPHPSPTSFSHNVQDPESSALAFLPRLDLEDEIEIRFTFITRQNAGPLPATPSTSSASTDTAITGLTFAYAQNAKELDTLITREFHADPNLHKNSNVQLLGDYATRGSPAITYEWTWQWKPPKPQEDKGGGWRNCCSFLEYDSRAHRLNTLASFTFWVHNASVPIAVPFASPGLEIPVMSQRHRMPSSQSYQSAISDSEGPFEQHNPPSPQVNTAEFGASGPTSAPAMPVIDVSCVTRPGDDVSAVEDGPVFRATMKALEQKTGTMKIQIKKVLKRAEAAQQAQVEYNQAMSEFLRALQEASNSSATAFKPALDHYFTNIAQHIMKYEKGNSSLLQKQIIDPISKLYNMDIKQVEAKKKDFDDESRDYYAYVGRYLGQRQDSLKDKKRAESDSKYQSKRKNFELKRFDYSTFMQDLHGGRKEQELLSQLTKYADGQAKAFLATAKKVENLTPQLDALVKEVSEADKEYNLQRTEREEKRRNLEKNGPVAAELESHHQAPAMSVSTQMPGQNGHTAYTSDTDLSRADSTSSQFGQASIKTLSPTTHTSVPLNSALSTSPSANSMVPTPSKFKGIRDLDDSSVSTEKTLVGQYRKEGLLWALSKPNNHIDPKGAWHKFWVVLDQGKLSEYSNWKDKLDLHRDPIDLRMASVRTARDAERRFCFEVITPQYKRVYQATSEDDMNHWINAINNALQSAFEAGGQAPQQVRKEMSSREVVREFGHALLGKSSSTSGPHGYSQRTDSSGVSRRITVGSRPTYTRTSSNSYDENPSKLLDQIRNNDQGNQYCADCGSSSKVEWVSLNLGIILCIECGGIHRSLGTHVSKIRSLTLDVHSFTNDIVELLMLIGNRISNMIWEATLDRSIRPTATATRDQRLKFITAKYVERAYVLPLSQHVSADDALLTSIKKHEIQGVLQSIAQRANVNAHDRSRNTHAVFLALASADPARPVSSHSDTPSGTVKAFPMAELLVQNGAEIPVDLPAIPLSAASRLYIDQRTTRAAPGGPTDTLGPLPIMNRISPLSSSLSETTSKLQKRGSAGARFAGKVAGLGER
jgi:Arf-GAP with SH3 domain, ANK repeat and PH domain-containing protein